MQAMQNSTSRRSLGGLVAAVLTAAVLLISTRYAGQAQKTPSAAPPRGVSRYYTPSARERRVEMALLSACEFLRPYMEANYIKGDPCVHVDVNAMPTVEGAQKTCVISYQFLHEMERTYSIPVRVTLHKGDLHFTQCGAPTTSDGSSPYQSQKKENAAVYVTTPHK